MSIYNYQLIPLIEYLIPQLPYSITSVLPFPGIPPDLHNITDKVFHSGFRVGRT
jgi:hypothetical protein